MVWGLSLLGYLVVNMLGLYGNRQHCYAVWVLAIVLLVNSHVREIDFYHTDHFQQWYSGQMLIKSREKVSWRPSAVCSSPRPNKTSSSAVQGTVLIQRVFRWNRNKYLKRVEMVDISHFNGISWFCQTRSLVPESSMLFRPHCESY